jgi:hypothetical protein
VARTNDLRIRLGDFLVLTEPYKLTLINGDIHLIHQAIAQLKIATSGHCRTDIGPQWTRRCRSGLEASDSSPPTLQAE